ncbi:putative membrane protein [Wenyingzhuangia heitensis]|uniref:Membrane protein n=1 Tax=Wenyingzhuangia heitensis TaxID=1487859 RepID=A0ABX0U530_9FLAO|nr:c-type cytochrome domain-containing protein [Wenyingzhuangia heitensis]NIJ43917.1 putative membrane protein [Wenyingzhuangia heitensis]
MKNKTKYVLQLLFVLHVFLGFLLVFENAVQVPYWVQPLGRMHPIILHFPVAFIGLLVLFTFAKKSTEKETYQKIHYQLLLLTAFTTVIATIMGFLLSLEGYESDLMQLHKWLGVALSFYMYLLVSIYSKKVYTPLLYMGLVLVVFVGHYGAGLTHGSTFITEPLQVEEEVNENSSVYAAHIQPILNNKCKSCHNAEKPKGGLDVTSIEAIKKGGKHGDLWLAHQPEKSVFLKRVLLPLSHKKHMAPDGKPQLTKEEIGLISLWIHQGINDTIRLADLKETDTLKQLIKTKWTTKETTPSYDFSFADDQVINHLSTSPYISIHTKSVNSPALDITVYGGAAYNTKFLEDLIPVKEQMVSLNTSNLAVTDKDVSVIKEFKNLEVLILNNTNITNKAIVDLKSLKNLTKLSVCGTQLDGKAIEDLKDLKSLNTLCIWGTKITKKDTQKLLTYLPNLNIERGVKNSDKKGIVAPPKIIGKENVKQNGDVIYLKHLDHNAIVKYSLGKEVNKDSETYKDGIVIDFKDKNAVVIKARAYKEGKNPSDEIKFKVFKNSIKINSLTTNFPNEMADYFGNGETLLIDNYLAQGTVTNQGWVSYLPKETLVAVLDVKDNTQKISELVLYCGTFYRFRFNCLNAVKVWGSNTKENWKLLDKITYPVKKKFDNQFQIRLKLKNTNYSYYKVEVAIGKSKKLFISQAFLY